MKIVCNGMKYTSFDKWKLNYSNGGQPNSTRSGGCLINKFLCTSMAFYKILTVKVNNIYNTPNDLYTIPSKLQYQYDMIFLMSGHHYIRLQAKPIWKHRTKL